jgi:hypothetical protein
MPTRPTVLLLAMLLAGCAVPAPPASRAVPPAPPALPGDAHIPPFARNPYEPFSRTAVVAIAEREWRAFGQPVVYPHTELPVDEERAEGLWQRVGEYWWLALDMGTPQQAWTGKHDESGQVFSDTVDGNFAWSAAFVSYVMRIAGAGRRFPYSENHSGYINAAARHDPGIVVSAERPEAYAPLLGDLICMWRGGRRIIFDDLPTDTFPGHCDIVVDTHPNTIDVIGGNVDNAVAMKHVPVAEDGKLAGPDGAILDPDYPWFVVLRVLYNR